MRINKGLLLGFFVISVLLTVIYFLLKHYKIVIGNVSAGELFGIFSSLFLTLICTYFAYLILNKKKRTETTIIQVPGFLKL